MRLNAGEQAIPFETADVNGNAVSLAVRPGVETLLCFYRYAGCPFCNLDLADLIEFSHRMAATNLRIIAFFNSTDEAVRKHPLRQHPPFPLVADADRRIYDLYGVESSLLGLVRSAEQAGRWIQAHRRGFPQRRVDGDFFLLPAQFLIMPDGMIAFSHYGRAFGDPTPFREVERYFEGKIR